MGAGEAVGYYLIQAKLPHLEQSVLFNAYKLNIPVTIHPAIGTDFIHYHPMFSGEITGALAERDFQLLASIVSELGGGGVFLNIGSAVILPEVFLKAVAFCSAQGIALEKFHTAVFDFNRHYRPLENVLPAADGPRRQGLLFRRPSRDHDAAAGGDDPAPQSLGRAAPAAWKSCHDFFPLADKLQAAAPLRIRRPGAPDRPAEGHPGPGAGPEPGLDDLLGPAGNGQDHAGAHPGPRGRLPVDRVLGHRVGHRRDQKADGTIAGRRARSTASRWCCSSTRSTISTATSRTPSCPTSSAATSSCWGPPPRTRPTRSTAPCCRG